MRTVDASASEGFYGIITAMDQAVSRPPKVAIFATVNLKGGRTSVRGILDYARRHGPWRCMLLEGRDSEQTLNPRLLGFDGIIAHNLSYGEAKAVAAANVPVVLIEPWPQQMARGNPLADAPYVKMNSYDVGVLAAEYYLDRGYRSFAYVGETLGMYWSADRRAGFADTLAKYGFDCFVYDTFSARERRSWAAERPRMMRFLKGLEKPTAIFAAMDNRARLVLDACAEAGIAVPEEIAVLGVDNDSIICESAVPTLSSIRTGGFRRGQMAASMLDDLMCLRPIRQRTVSMGPLSVVTRESTGYDAMRNPVLARALKFIHAHAAQSRIDVADVVAVAGCSRRYAEVHFRRHLGISIHDTIMRTRLERVKAMLEQSNLSIGEISERCAFARESHLAVLFKKATGISMREYRRLRREEPDD